MSDKIASLELELRSNSESAVGGLERLANTLGKLKSSTQGLGLGAVANQLTKIRDASAGINGTTASNVEHLAKALQLLSGTKVSASIGNQIAKINEALSKLNVGDGGTKIQELVTALKPLETLGKNSLGSTVNALNKLPEALSKIDMRTLHGQVDALTRTMRPLAVEMEKIANGFKAFPSRIQKLITSNQKLQTSNTKLQASNKATSLSFVTLMAKFTTTYMIVRRAVSAIMGFVKLSSTYTENMNLFTVAMGQYAEEAAVYGEKIGELMGIDPGDWARSQGLFMTLATGFGVAGERASVMSQQLTQLGYDISSFYNISVEDAMTKLQSGLSGELEPLRRLGYDLSQAKLEATALSLGIDKSVSSMTQAEKAELRYHAILNQVTTSHGDMARTIATPANQLRILSSQVQQAGRAIGNIFIPVLSKMLPYLSAFFQTVRAVANVIASLVGYEPPKFDNSGMNGLASGAEEVTEGLDNATDAAKKLKSYTMGFDELNVIDPNSGGSDNAGDALGGGGFDFDLTTYDFLKDLEESPITKIAEKMKEWLGITDEIDTWSELMDTRLGSILKTVGAIGIAFMSWKIGVGVYAAVHYLSVAMSSISGIASGVSVAIGAISAPVLALVGAALLLVGALAYVYTSNEEVRESFNEAVRNISESFVPLFEYVTNTVIPNIKTQFIEWSNILKPLASWLEGTFTSIWNDILIPALEYVASTIVPSVTRTFKNLWETVIIPLSDAMRSVFAPAIEWVASLLDALWKTVVLPLADCVGGIFKSEWELLITVFNTALIPLVGMLIDVFNILWREVLLPVSSFVRDVVSAVFVSLFETLKKIIEGVKLSFTSLIDFVTNVFTGNWKNAWENVKGIFEGIWTSLSAVLKAPLNTSLSILECFINKIIDGWNAVKSAINSMSLEVPEWLGGGTLGFNLKMSKHIKIPQFAEGGYPERGQLFIANETGAGAEMVGAIGRRTAVANNDQIVDGITSGVAEANSEQNALLREQNALLRALLDKDSNVNLDGRRVSKQLDRVRRERGATIVTGGAY